MEKYKNISFYFIIIFLILIVFCYINMNKPLQMDELSSYHHSSNKSFIELVNSTRVGIDWMPIPYFYILWAIDRIWELNQFTIRLPNIIFCTTAIIFLFKALEKNFGLIASKVGVFTVLSHSLLFPFILTEARPYALYFLTASFLFFVTANLKIRNNNFSFVLCLANFLLPFTFYIGGIFALLGLLSIVIQCFLNKQRFINFVLSAATGWTIFFLLSVSTLYDQLKNTKATIKANNITIFDIFSEYGTFMYFPLAYLVLIVITYISHQKKFSFLRKSMKTSVLPKPSNLILILSTLWLLLPFLMFIVGKSTGHNFLKSRYFTPNLITFSYIISFFTYFFILRFKFNTYTIKFYYLICFTFLIVNSRSLCRAYSTNSEYASLSFLDNISFPIFTLNMNAAFHISHYHDNEVYFIVADDNFATDFTSFSNNFKTISLGEFQSEDFNIKFVKNNQFIFILGNYLPFDIQSFSDTFHYEIVNVLELNTTEYSSAYFMKYLNH